MDTKINFVVNYKSWTLKFDHFSPFQNVISNKLPTNPPNLQEYPFGVNLVQKIKIVSLSWNLVSILIWICKIQQRCVTFSIFDRKYHFWGKFGPKNQIVSLSWNLISTLIWICKIQWWCSLFPFSTENTFFGENLVQKIKIVS